MDVWLGDLLPLYLAAPAMLFHGLRISLPLYLVAPTMLVLGQAISLFSALRHPPWRVQGSPSMPVPGIWIFLVFTWWHLLCQSWI